jgi:uncharacterized phage-associated protein
MIFPKPSKAADRVSDILILESRQRGDALTNLKLQKLLYYAQAWFLATHSRELFPEDFQAWVHGPVLPSQYHRFKHNEWRPIEDKIHGDLKTGNILIDKHLVQVIDVFGTETAGSLELMTHSEKPWLVARQGLSSSAPSTAIISKEIMRDFYRSL